MCSGVAVIEIDRLARRLASARMSLGDTLAPAENRLEMAQNGKITQRHRIARIQADGLGQQTSSRSEIGSGKASDVPMRSHDPVPGVEPIGILLLGVADLGGNDAGRDSAGNTLSDLVLDGKHIREVAVVAVGPKMVSGPGVDQLRGDPHAFADAAYAALDDVADPELGADLGDIDSRPL